MGSPNYELGAALVLDVAKRAIDGYFLRSETHLDTASTTVSDTGAALRQRSHGESILDLASDRFHSSGLFLLDEPEAGLSVIRQFALIIYIVEAARAGGQFIIATHSPVLLAMPEAEIIELDEDGFTRPPLEETIAFRVWEDFLEDPHGFAEYMASLKL